MVSGGNGDRGGYYSDSGGNRGWSIKLTEETKGYLFVACIIAYLIIAVGILARDIKKVRDAEEKRVIELQGLAAIEQAKFDQEFRQNYGPAIIKLEAESELGSRWRPVIVRIENEVKTRTGK